MNREVNAEQLNEDINTANNGIKPYDHFNNCRKYDELIEEHDLYETEDGTTLMRDEVDTNTKRFWADYGELTPAQFDKRCKEYLGMPDNEDYFGYKFGSC